MKATLFTTLLTLAATGTASPTDNEGYRVARRNTLDQRALDEAPAMEFTGPVVVGGPDVTLSGTADSIYAQILKLNPEYDPWNFPEYQEKMAALNITKEAQAAGVLSKRDSSLVKRADITCNPQGKDVGNWITQCSEGLNYLSKLNGYCAIPKGPAGCARVSCSHSCGIHVCNDNKFAIKVWCGNMVGDVYDIAAECQFEWNDYVSSLKGQVFRKGSPAWNTIVKENSC